MGVEWVRCARRGEGTSGCEQLAKDLETWLRETHERDLRCRFPHGEADWEIQSVVDSGSAVVSGLMQEGAPERADVFLAAVERPEDFHRSSRPMVATVRGAT